MEKRCLIISDDLTGGADTGVQFSKRGLTTFLITARGTRGLDLARYRRGDILVVNTGSRSMRPQDAISTVSEALREYSRELFPIVYKKIDSTLRGNIGFEIDAVLAETGIPMAFMAPSFPAQNRTLVGGIMMVAGKPISLTEMARDAVSPVSESHIWKLVRRQSAHRVGWIDLTYVSAGPEQLTKAISTEKRMGSRIIIFDAVQQGDLANIAEVALSMDRIPLLVGSAGLAGEVARKISPAAHGCSSPAGPVVGARKHVFIISGSASSVTHKQLERLEKSMGIESFELGRSLLMEGEQGRREHERYLCQSIAKAISRGHAILKATSERISPSAGNGYPTHSEITGVLGSIAASVLDLSAGALGADDLAIVLTGGETAMSVLDCLGVSGIEIEREITGGIALSRVFEGKLEGLAVVTKAGAFGEEDALEKIMAAVGAGL